MLIHVGFEVAFEFAQPTPVLVMPYHSSIAGLHDLGDRTIHDLAARGGFGVYRYLR